MWTKKDHGNKQSVSIKVQNTQLEEVDTFPNLGSLITVDFECGKEIWSQLAKSQVISVTMKNLWKDHTVKIPTKIHLTKALTGQLRTAVKVGLWRILTRKRLNAF